MCLHVHIHKHTHILSLTSSRCPTFLFKGYSDVENGFTGINQKQNSRCQESLRSKKARQVRPNDKSTVHHLWLRYDCASWVCAKRPNCQSAILQIFSMAPTGKLKSSWKMEEWTFVTSSRQRTCSHHFHPSVHGQEQNNSTSVPQSLQLLNRN